MAEPSVGQWRPRWRRKGQDPLLRIHELEPSSLPAEDNLMQKMRWAWIFGMPVLLLLYLLIQLLGRRVELCNSPGRHRRPTIWVKMPSVQRLPQLTQFLLHFVLWGLSILVWLFLSLESLDSKEKRWYNGFCIPPLTWHSTTDQRAHSLVVTFTPQSLFLVAPLESLCVCVWQNGFEKLGSGNEELQRDCTSAGWAGCHVWAF